MKTTRGGIVFVCADIAAAPTIWACGGDYRGVAASLALALAWAQVTAAGANLACGNRKFLDRCMVSVAAVAGALIIGIGACRTTPSEADVRNWTLALLVHLVSTASAFAVMQMIGHNPSGIKHVWPVLRGIPQWSLRSVFSATTSISILLATSLALKPTYADLCWGPVRWGLNTGFEYGILFVIAAVGHQLGKTSVGWQQLPFIACVAMEIALGSVAMGHGDSFLNRWLAGRRASELDYFPLWDWQPFVRIAMVEAVMVIFTILLREEEGSE